MQVEWTVVKVIQIGVVSTYAYCILLVPSDNPQCSPETLLDGCSGWISYSPLAQQDDEMRYTAFSHQPGVSMIERPLCVSDWHMLGWRWSCAVFGREILAEALRQH